MAKKTQARVQWDGRQQEAFMQAVVNSVFPAPGAYAVNPFNLPGIPGMGQQLSQTDTSFSNLRWYLASNLRQLLSQMYVELGLVKTIVDVPVDDALRGGVIFESKQLGAKNVIELQNVMERNNDLTNTGQAAKWNRLFGGAGLVVLSDQDPELPLDVEMLNENSNLQFKPADLWELFWDRQNQDSQDPLVMQEQDWEFYSYYGHKLHKSRVLKFDGEVAPSFIRPRLRGWGTSVVEVLVRSLNQHLKTEILLFELLDEAKIDVYLVKNLVQMLNNPGGEAAVQRRFMVNNQMKSVQNALILDSQDDWKQKQLSFSGLGEVWKEIRIQIASELRMPLTKIFGISAAGFNSGEDDIEVYNGMVESSIRGKMKPNILKVAELRCQEMFGFVPDDLSVTYHPLRVLSSQQEEEVKNAKFGRVLQALQANTITKEQYAEMVNKDKLLPLPIDVDAMPDPEEFEVQGGDGMDEELSLGNRDPKAAKEAKEAKPAKDPK